MHPVTILRRRPSGPPVKVLDPCGAVFAPSPVLGPRAPVYSYGHGQAKDPVFTCPVSALPGAVWRLYMIWLTSRALKLAPRPGGALDQPEIIQRAFLLFEAEALPLEREAAGVASAHMANVMLAAMMGKR